MFYHLPCITVIKQHNLILHSHNFQAFESQNEVKKKVTQSGSDQSSPDEPEASPVHTKSKEEEKESHQEGASSSDNGVFDANKEEKLQRLPKNTLGKTRSAGLVEVSNTDSDGSPEFKGVKNRPLRALSEKSPGILENFNKPDKEDSQQTESKANDYLL